MKLIKYQSATDPKRVRTFDVDVISDNDLRSYGWLPYQEPVKIFERPAPVAAPIAQPKQEITIETTDGFTIPEVKPAINKRTPRKTTTKPKQ